ncbi:MAG: TIR domain-containing protein [Verrucomicrobia bacterium]|nr:TIR domain-containing protein [Verrucomicrobiota bacterium]
MSEPGKAVFLSYASQDAEAATRVCDALRAAGVEVWFDQSEPLDSLGAHGLVGGDAWDAKIRKQIAECALFVPVISAATQARGEGYFRIEWKLAAQRTHTMADERTFLLPVVIDATRDADAKVPAEFKAVQWTRLPGGETPAAFGERVKQLLAGGIEATDGPRPVPTFASAPSPRSRDDNSWIAVLPFKHRGADADVAALAEGITEGVVTGLSRSSYLRVIANSSTARFAHEAVDIRTAGLEREASSRA